MKTWTHKNTLQERNELSNNLGLGLLALIALPFLLIFGSTPPPELIWLSLFIGIFLVATSTLLSYLRKPWSYYIFIPIVVAGTFYVGWSIGDNFIEQFFCYTILTMSLITLLMRKQLLRWSRLRWQDLSADEQDALQQAMAKEQARDEQAEQKSRKNKQAI